MAKRLSMFVLVVLLVIGVQSQSSVALTSHTVGNTTGWRIPTGGATTYSTWSSQQTFFVGDVLVFNFNSAVHDVREVSKAMFDDCSTGNPISSTTTSPASIKLTSAGVHYFICSVSGHCEAGQKLSVSVLDASTAVPPTSVTSPSTALPPSSAASLRAMTWPVVLLSIAVGCIFHFS